MTPEQAKTCPLKAEWLDHYRERLRILAEGGIMGHPRERVEYRKSGKTMTIVTEPPEFRGSVTDILNIRCFEALGYTVVRTMDAPIGHKRPNTKPSDN